MPAPSIAGMRLCASLVDETPPVTKLAISNSPPQQCVLEYWKNCFLMGYADNSFGGLIQRASLPLDKFCRRVFPVITTSNPEEAEAY